MSRTILYYNIYLTRNGIKTSVPVQSLIDVIYPMDDMGKFWNQKKLSLLHLKLIDTEHPLNSLNRSIALAKYRETYKPYTGRIGTNMARPIEDDVIEFTNCFFIGQFKQIAIEYNHIGSRPNEIVEYLSSFLPKQPQNFWDILLEPIETRVGLTDIRQSSKIYSIELSIDCTRDVDNTFETDSFFGSFIDKTRESHQEFGANVATIKFGNGRKRIDVIEAQQLVRLLTHLNIEDEIFASVRVDYHSPNTGRREKVDLKNQNILKSVILEGDAATGYEYILDQMESKFNIDNRPGNTAYQQFEDEVEYAELPEITPHTLPEEAEAGA
ncbi:DUF6731 family protein [Virgibacillus sp. DJP39]|uniref:DUF6731 family protein n=1 Tax=Virgibacillus sp. DJP39 TaxID=3409790 RepID=UPI003BB70A65